MSLFNTIKVESLHDVFIHKIKVLYDIEKRLVEALPKMRDAANDPKLKQGFDRHLHETEEQVSRLEQAFSLLKIEPERITSEVLKALVSEGEKIISASGEDSVRDAVLISAGQAVEHFEIALYGTARTWATTLGYEKVGNLLQATLEEEEDTNEALSTLAEEEVNLHAIR